MGAVLRLSPSLVDSFEYWQSLEDEERAAASLEELLASIRGERREPTPALRLGRDWHDAIDPSRSLVLDGDAYVVGEHYFAAEDVDTYRAALPAGLISEAWGDLDLPEVGVRLRLRADGLHGNAVIEHKHTSGQIKVDRYVGSVQWRCYLLAFRADVVRYTVVRLQRDGDLWRVGDALDFSQRAYPGMRADVARRVGALADFIRRQGLAEYRLEAA